MCCVLKQAVGAVCSLSQADPDAQLAWLDTAFSSARAECDWVFAIGHHPIYSAGDHGDHPGLLAKFLPLFQKHSVASYIAGHDHDLQHIQMQGFNYVVSGAGYAWGVHVVGWVVSG